LAAPKITIREKIDLISKIEQINTHRFAACWEIVPRVWKIVVTFLALLELVKRYRVEARQEGLFSDIEIDRLEAWQDDEEIGM